MDSPLTRNRGDNWCACHFPLTHFLPLERRLPNIRDVHASVFCQLSIYQLEDDIIPVHLIRQCQKARCGLTALRKRQDHPKFEITAHFSRTALIAGGSPALQSGGCALLASALQSFGFPPSTTPLNRFPLTAVTRYQGPSSRMRELRRRSGNDQAKYADGQPSSPFRSA